MSDLGHGAGILSEVRPEGDPKPCRDRPRLPDSQPPSSSRIISLVFSAIISTAALVFPDTPDIAAALELKSGRGAILSKIDPKSAAEKAGLKPGDVVVAVNGNPINNSSDLRNRIDLMPVGEKGTLTILRNGQSVTIDVEIGKASAAEIASRDGVPQLSGAVITDISRNHRMYGKIDGAIVAQVEPGSRAWRNALRQGEIIVAVKPAKTPGVSERNTNLGRSTERSAFVQSRSSVVRFCSRPRRPAGIRMWRAGSDAETASNADCPRKSK